MKRLAIYMALFAFVSMAYRLYLSLLEGGCERIREMGLKALKGTNLRSYSICLALLLVSWVSLFMDMISLVGMLRGN